MNSAPFYNVVQGNNVALSTDVHPRVTKENGCVHRETERSMEYRRASMKVGRF